MTKSTENMFEKYTLMENQRWKGLFKEGHFYISECRPDLSDGT